MSKRIVKRVLVMLEYGDGDPNNGEVFDLTALAVEMATNSSWHASNLNIDVRASQNWAPFGQPRDYELSVTWGGSAGEFVTGATHLEDVVNSALPDGDRVRRIKRAAKRGEERIKKLQYDAMVAKLEQVASIRHQHPIARVTQTAPQLAEVNGGERSAA